METKVVAIANYFINKGIEEDKLVSNLRLQKLMYFAWGEYWVWHKEHLFEEEFYSWKYDMYIPELYQKLKDINGDNFYLNNIRDNFLLKNTIEGCDYVLSDKDIDSISRSYNKHKGLGEWDIPNLNSSTYDSINYNEEILSKDRIKKRFETIDYIYTNFGHVFAKLAKM